MKSLEEAGERQGVEPFGACLGLFSRLSRSAPEARVTFEEIEAHRTDLQIRLQRDPGFAVAAADYLQLVDGLGWHRGERPPAFGSSGRSGERSFDQVLAGEWRRHDRHGRPLSLLLLSPWCPIRPEAVAAAAAAVSEAVRDIDQPARVLPDGMALLLPGTRGEEGATAARRLVAIAGRASGGPWCGGVAALPGSARDAAGFGIEVGEALAVALREGPGRVHLSRPERRRHPRRVAAGSLLGRLRVQDRVVLAEVVDLSVEGALVATPIPMQRGEPLVLEVTERAPRGRSAQVNARVLRSDPGPHPAQGPWVAALQFETPGGDLPSVTHILAGLAADEAPVVPR